MNSKSARVVVAVVVVALLGLGATARRGPASSAAADDVSYGDYVAAIEATRACLARAGIQTTPARAVGDHMLRFSMSYPVSAVATADGDYRSCYERFLLQTEAAWAAQNVPDDAERAARRHAIASCLREENPAFPQDPSADQINEAMRRGAGVPSACVKVIAEIGTY